MGMYNLKFTILSLSFWKDVCMSVFAFDVDELLEKYN